MQTRLSKIIVFVYFFFPPGVFRSARHGRVLRRRSRRSQTIDRPIRRRPKQTRLVRSAGCFPVRAGIRSVRGLVRRPVRRPVRCRPVRCRSIRCSPVCRRRPVHFLIRFPLRGLPVRLRFVRFLLMCTETNQQSQQLPCTNHVPTQL